MIAEALMGLNPIMLQPRIMKAMEQQQERTKSHAEVFTPAWLDEAKRLKHIFQEQVYGLAPTEIIYKIATNFIMGFNSNITITEHNFKQADALEYAKQGNLEQFLDELYGSHGEYEKKCTILRDTNGDRSHDSS
ncbi:MAG: hypothetical protein NC416_17755 [Eubacterium sp.]|nr:hypothetical protein [Eubacterium sp.]